MDPKMKEIFQKEMAESFDTILATKLAPFIGDTVAMEVKRIVGELRTEKAAFGYDRTGLTDKQKSDFAEAAKAIAFNRSIDTKANEALISEQDNRGGYLVSSEVANAIVRIAASVGLAMSQAAKWTMTTDELAIPNYTGSFLEGEYLDVDAAGSVTGINFGAAKLIAKKWQLAFVVGNDLLADASVDLANWLLAMGGEALANMIDKQVFAGTGAPVVGILNHSGVTTFTLASGKNTFAEFNVVEDSSSMIGNLEESVLEGAAFYMNRTVWASLRTQKDTAGNYILPNAGAASAGVLANVATGGGKKPAGEILGFPVYTTRHLPALSESDASKNFIIFGNLQGVAFGNKGEMRVEQYNSGSFGGKEIALSDQKAMVIKHRHAAVIALPAAFVVGKTAAS